MILEQRVPSPGESITEAEIVEWLKEDGEWVDEDEALCEIESEKVTLTMHAEKSGVLKILVPAKTTVAIDTVACAIDTDAPRPECKSEPRETKLEEQPSEAEKAPEPEKPTREPLPDRSAKPSPPTTGSQAKKPAEKIISHDGRPVRRERLTQLRQKISERLVAVKNQTAMLTTFNELDMSAIMDVRSKYKEQFEKEHGVRLGFMSFFTRAVCEAIQDFPAINASIEGDELVFHDYVDVGIAVSAPKGLMVPIIRDADRKTFAQIEKTILDLAQRAKENKISIDELTGGTFTISNGGIFGSMLSTPILNPPQSAILGMHNIQERPIANKGRVVIRPMMYLALSYDHRVIDGRESVSFLMKVKELLEDPVKLLLGVQ